MLGSDCSVAKKSPQDFDLTIPSRTYVMKCVEYTADEWVNILQKEISRLAISGAGPGGESRSRQGTGMTLEDC